MEKNKNSDKIRKDMEKAQKLIKAKKFDDARAILITIDDPTAEKWLDKLNQMAPVTQVTVQEKKKPGCVQQVASAAALLFICAIVYGIANPKSGSGGSRPRATSASQSSSNSNSGDSPTDAPELGSRGNPYPAGEIQEVRDGRLRVNSIEMDMNAEVHRMNMFNTEPDSGQEWVIVDATFFCDLDSDAVCNTGAMQFELVGTEGHAYNQEIMAVIDNVFGAEVFGGGQSTGSIAFIAESSDSKFLLAVVDSGREFFAIP